MAVHTLIALTLLGTPAAAVPEAIGFVPRNAAPGVVAWAGAERDGFRIRVREVVPPERGELLWKHLAVEGDLFDIATEDGPAFRTFLLEADNQSKLPVLFNPSFFTLAFSDNRRFPLGYTQVYSPLMAVAEHEGEVEKLAPLLQETSVTIPPGGRVVRLLVFERVPGKTRSATLMLAEIRVGDKELSARLQFEKPRPRKD